MKLDVKKCIVDRLIETRREIIAIVITDMKAVWQIMPGRLTKLR